MKTPAFANPVRSSRVKKCESASGWFRCYSRFSDPLQKFLFIFILFCSFMFFSGAFCVLITAFYHQSILIGLHIFKPTERAMFLDSSGHSM